MQHENMRWRKQKGESSGTVSVLQIQIKQWKI